MYNWQTIQVSNVGFITVQGLNEGHIGNRTYEPFKIGSIYRALGTVKQQSITGTNVDPLWRHIVSLGLNELKARAEVTRRRVRTKRLLMHSSFISFLYTIASHGNNVITMLYCWNHEEEIPWLYGPHYWPFMPSSFVENREPPTQNQGSFCECAQPMRNDVNNVVSHWLGAYTK